MPPRGGVYELLTYLAADNVNRLPSSLAATTLQSFWNTGGVVRVNPTFFLRGCNQAAVRIRVKSAILAGTAAHGALEPAYRTLNGLASMALSIPSRSRSLLICHCSVLHMPAGRLCLHSKN